jgi:hypothetical protein
LTQPSAGPKEEHERKLISFAGMHGMKTASIVWKLFLLLLLLAPGDARAQGGEVLQSGFEIDLHASAHRFGSPQLGDRQDYGAGARVMYDMPYGLAIGGGVGWLRDEFEARFIDDPEEPIAFVEDLYFYGGEMEYAFRPGRTLRPYVGLGLGAVTIHSESRPQEPERDQSETFPFAPASAGILWLDNGADPGFGLRIGVRDNIVWFGDEGARVVRPDDGAVHNLEFLGGIAIFPGGLTGS